MMRMKRGIKPFGAFFAWLLLSTGFSMCSLAAGWTQEGGSWAFYDEYGSPVKNKWEKYGDNWYWLDNSGLMAVDQIIEEDGDYYYVDANGAMAANQWVQVENTSGGEDSPPFWWYYFQNNGKAYKAKKSGKTSLVTINDKSYAFTAEGRMLFGWVDENSARQTDDSAWADCLYYMGGEDDGAAAIGWAQIHVTDCDTERWDKKNQASDEQDYWFYFQSDGKKVHARERDDLKTMTINGHKYSFDETGRMAFEWVSAGNTASGSSGAASSSVTGYYYFNDRDNGAQVSQGWFKVVPNQGVNLDDSGDEEARWFYAYREGKICASQFKTIDGKKYCFDNSGRMLTGLQAVYTDSAGRVWNRKLDDEDGFKDATALTFGGNTYLRLVNENGEEIEDELTVRQALVNVSAGEDPYREDGKKKKPAYGVYYFGGEDDGAARTSRQTVDLEGESHTFYFAADGSKKGKGFNGFKDRHLYQEGLRVKAREDNKYEAYIIAAEPWQKDEDGKPVAVDSQEYQEAYRPYCPGDTYFVPGHVYPVGDDEIVLLHMSITRGGSYGVPIVKVANSRIYLVSATGSIVQGTKTVRNDGGLYQIYEDSTVLYAHDRSLYD